MAEVTEALVGAGGTGPVARRTGGKQHQFYKERKAKGREGNSEGLRVGTKEEDGDKPRRGK